MGSYEGREGEHDRRCRVLANVVFILHVYIITTVLLQYYYVVFFRSIQSIGYSVFSKSFRCDRHKPLYIKDVLVCHSRCGSRLKVSRSLFTCSCWILAVPSVVTSSIFFFIYCYLLSLKDFGCYLLKYFSLFLWSRIFAAAKSLLRLWLEGLLVGPSLRLIPQ